MAEELWRQVRGEEEAVKEEKEKLRFASEVVGGEVLLFNKTSEQIADCLKERGFIPGSDGTYEQLLSTPVSYFTVDGMKKLEAKISEQLEKISHAKKTAKEFACQKLQERKQNIQRRKEKLEQILSELNNKKEELLKNFASLNEDMRQKVGTVADALDQREIELLNQINRLEQTKKTQQVEIREDLKVLEDGLANSIRVVNSAMQKQDPYDFLEAIAALETTVDEQLSNIDLTAVRRFRPDFEVKLDIDYPTSVIRQLSIFPAQPQLVDHQVPTLGPEPAAVPEDAAARSKEVSLRSVSGMSHGSSSFGDMIQLEDMKRNRAVQVEKSQIHMISATTQGKERSSIITISSRQQENSAGGGGEREAIGAHRARRGLEGEGGGTGNSSEAKQQEQQVKLTVLTQPEPTTSSSILFDHIQNGSLLKLSNLSIEIKDLLSLPFVLTSYPTLTTVDLTDSNVGDAGAKIVAEALAANMTVTALGLSGNKIGDEGIHAISKSLACNRAILSLFLRNNSIGPFGAKQIFSSLMENFTITKLNLKNNHIGEEGVSQLVPMLQKNQTLLELNLWSNNIGPGGAAAIAMALSDTSAGLVDLDLGCNGIGNEGLTALAQALRTNLRLERLNVRWNEIDDEGVLEAARTLAGTNCLKEMNLFGNKLSSDGKAQAELQRQVSSIKVMK